MTMRYLKNALFVSQHINAIEIERKKRWIQHHSIRKASEKVKNEMKV